MRDAEGVAQRPEMFVYQVGRESVVARRHRRMGGEDGAPAYLPGRGLEVDALPLDAPAHRFEHRERAVPLVEVEDAGHDAQRMQRLQPADAEQQLLPNAHADVAPVEPRRQGAVLRRVPLDVRVEQQERPPPHGRLPYPRAQGSGAGRDHRHDRLAVRPDRRLQWQLGEVYLRVVLLLPAGGVEPLPEIALAIEQADADERDAQVGGALDVVAGQHAEAARVDRQRLVDAELRGEVGDRLATQNADVRVPPTLRTARGTPAAAETRG